VRRHLRDMRRSDSTVRKGGNQVRRHRRDVRRSDSTVRKGGNQVRRHRRDVRRFGGMRELFSDLLAILVCK
jgi:hypothetical protein